MGRVLLGLLVQVGFAPPLFLSSTGGNRKEREREREGGRRPSSLSYSDSQGGGARPPPVGFPLSPLGLCWPNTSPRGSGNPSVLRKNTRITRNHSDVRI